MIIAIDFDDTFTCDPEGWVRVIRLMMVRGHDVIMVSSRRNTDVNRSEITTYVYNAGGYDILGEILLVYDEPKRQAAKRLGFDVDVWIAAELQRIEDETNKR